MVYSDGGYLWETQGDGLRKKSISNRLTSTDSFILREKESSFVADLAGAQFNETHEPAQEIVTRGKNMTH